MQSLYQRDLAYVHAAAFGSLAKGAATEIVRQLQSSSVQVRRVMDVGCGAGVLTKALTDVGFEVTGIDTSAELLEFARTSVPILAHMRDVCTLRCRVQGHKAEQQPQH